MEYTNKNIKIGAHFIKLLCKLKNNLAASNYYKISYVYC